MKTLRPFHLIAGIALLLISTVAKSDEIKNEVAIKREAVSWLGVNLAGAEFGDIGPSANKPNIPYPGRRGTEYDFPKAAELDFYKSRGRRTFRLPFKWERVQPKLNAPLDAAQLKVIDAVVEAAAAREMLVLLDCHNYARYNLLAPDGKSTKGYKLGSEELPDSAFADLWRRLAEHYNGKLNVAILGYGLMNEPHDMGDGQIWPRAAQAATDAIREVDTKTAIFVAGDSWSGAHSWRKSNENLDIHDASDNIVYEAHQYFDSNSSGVYGKSYDDEAKNAKFDAQIGVERARPFVEWCRDKKRRGFIGEFAVPGNDARWLTILENFLTYVQANDIGGTYWAGGPRWPPGDKLALEWDGRGTPERPQMRVLKQFPGGFPVAAEDPREQFLIDNGDFESGKDNWPRSFERSANVSWESENVDGATNQFLHLQQLKAGEFTHLYHLVPLPTQTPRVELQFRFRTLGVQRGREPYYDARFIFHWRDAQRQPLKIEPQPSSVTLPDDALQWTEKSVSFEVPAGAAFLEIMPALFQTQSGALDIDDLRLK